MRYERSRRTSGGESEGPITHNFVSRVIEGGERGGDGDDADGPSRESVHSLYRIPGDFHSSAISRVSLVTEGQGN